MSITGLEVFDATVHKTNTWLKRLMEIEGWESRQLAYTGPRRRPKSDPRPHSVLAILLCVLTVWHEV